MFPIVVSMTARYFDSSSAVVDTNGSGTGAGLSRMVAFLISTRSLGIVMSAGTVEIVCATVMPSTTRANTVY